MQTRRIHARWPVKVKFARAELSVLEMSFFFFFFFLLSMRRYIMGKKFRAVS